MRTITEHSVDFPGLSRLRLNDVRGLLPALVLSSVALLSAVRSGAETAVALDPAFGTGGEVIASFPSYSGANDAAVLPDGSIVAAGDSPGLSSQFPRDLSVARFGQDGMLDGLFGTGGLAVAAFVDGQVGHLTSRGVRVWSRVTARSSSSASPFPRTGTSCWPAFPSTDRWTTPSAPGGW
jgi:hypothetical protein